LVSITTVQTFGLQTREDQIMTKTKQTISMQQANQFRIPKTNLESFLINETDCIKIFKKSLF